MTPLNRGQACKTPLVDLLRSVPVDAVDWYEHGPTSHSQIPYGLHCRDALATIERLTGELVRAKSKISQFIEGECPP